MFGTCIDSITQNMSNLVGIHVSQLKQTMDNSANVPEPFKRIEIF